MPSPDPRLSSGCHLPTSWARRAPSAAGLRQPPGRGYGSALRAAQAYGWGCWPMWASGTPPWSPTPGSTSSWPPSS